MNPEVKASLAVGFHENVEDLEPLDHVLHGESHLRQPTIVSPSGVGERVMPARS